MPDPLASLTPRQQELLTQWLPGLQVVRDHSWGVVDNSVLEVVSGGRRSIVKADGAGNDHIRRELDAHERWLAPWVSAGRAPAFVAGDRDAKLLVTEFLPGELVLGSPAQSAPDTFRQAGRLLAQLHAQPGRSDAAYEAAENAKVLRNLASPHRVPPPVADRVRELVGSWPAEPVALVPTHGDWQPRNWLWHDGRVAVIDFGRAALRPALSDLVRLAARDFAWDPARADAFVDGYGADPRGTPAFLREQLREAANTAVWAHRVGDESFEAEGLSMLDRLLPSFA